jgi:hypothetical protein
MLRHTGCTRFRRANRSARAKALAGLRMKHEPSDTTCRGFRSHPVVLMSFCNSLTGKAALAATLDGMMRDFVPPGGMLVYAEAG